MTIVVLAVTVVLLLGFAQPSLNTVKKETLRESREEFRETVRHNPQRGETIPPCVALFNNL